MKKTHTRKGEKETLPLEVNIQIFKKNYLTNEKKTNNN